MAALRGIFVPFVVPLDEEGSINEPELRRYLDWLIERGVNGFYANGSTGDPIPAYTDYTCLRGL